MLDSGDARRADIEPTLAAHGTPALGEKPERAAEFPVRACEGPAVEGGAAFLGEALFFGQLAEVELQVEVTFEQRRQLASIPTPGLPLLVGERLDHPLGHPLPAARFETAPLILIPIGVRGHGATKGRVGRMEGRIAACAAER